MRRTRPREQDRAGGLPAGRHYRMGAIDRGASPAVDRRNEESHASRRRKRLGKYVRRRSSLTAPVERKRGLRRRGCCFLPEAQTRVQGPVTHVRATPKGSGNALNLVALRAMNAGEFDKPANSPAWRAPAVPTGSLLLPSECEAHKQVSESNYQDAEHDPTHLRRRT